MTFFELVANDDRIHYTYDSTLTLINEYKLLNGNCCMYDSSVDNWFIFKDSENYPLEKYDEVEIFKLDFILIDIHGI